MEVISYKDINKWNSIIKSFSHWDVYYLHEHAYSLMLHGDGEPYLFYFEGSSARMCFVAMKQDIANCDWAKGWLPRNSYYDMETPYGYGGSLVEGDVEALEQIIMYEELEAYCRQHNTISLFLRFCPWLKNQDCFNYKMLQRKERDTIFMDTTSEELILKNMDSKNRNMVRKAIKNGVEIIYDQGDRINDFIKIYKATMDNNRADQYYYFDKGYFEYLIEHLKDNIIFFYSMYDSQVIGSSIFFYNDQMMHYHLSGTYPEYRKLASTNLLIYEAAMWGNARGITKLHLGGGLQSEDSLFAFKKQFNKDGRLPFYIGRMVFEEEKYRELLQLRKLKDSNFNVNNSFLIQYRR